MGVDGLLRQLKEAVQETHLSRYRGQAVVVDAFSWLHKACYGCAFELATGKETDAYVRYMLRKVELLRSCGIQDVILVFDGDRLPLKAMTHAKRSDSKKENRELAFQYMADAKRLQGNARQDEVSKAYQHFQRAVSITPQVVNTVMGALKQANIKFVVAPFEADAQMVWMCKAGVASAIVTEDSDVLVYCMAADVDCPVLFKLDDGGIVQALSRSILHTNTLKTENAFLKKLHHLTTGDKEATRMFVQFCALAGCDFLDSLPNMGIVTALKHVFSFRGAPGNVRVQRLLSKLTSTGVKVPATFYKQFQQTESIFYHHVIFNMHAHACEFLIDDAHPKHHADVFERVKEAMGMNSGQLCLHSLGKPRVQSFLGTIPSRDVMIAVFNGDRCFRAKQQLPGDSVGESEQTATADDRVGNKVEHPEEAEATSPLSRHLPVRKPTVSDPVATERRRLVREQQRDASMRSLIGSYNASGASEVKPAHVDTAAKLLNSVAEVPTSVLPMKRSTIHASSKDTMTIVSLRDLSQRHARTSTPEEKKKQTAVPNRNKATASLFKIPESAKKRRLIGPGSSSKSPTTPSRTDGTPTLLQFFQKA